MSVYGPDGFTVVRSNIYGQTDKTTNCKICIEAGLVNRHYHHSTAFQFEKSQNKEVVKCAYCKIWHSPVRGDRIAVIFSDSTLADTYLQPDVRNPVHIDTETISGGRLRDGRQRWSVAYGNCDKGIDTAIVMGLNDMKYPRVRVEFAKELENWEKVIRKHEKKFGVRDTVQVARMMVAPQYGWFPANGKFPSDDYVNRMSDIEFINDEIDNFNTRQGAFHMVGFNREGTQTTRSGLRKHRFPAWRENPDKANCLHLNDEGRGQMYNRVVKYLMNRVI